MLGLVVDAWGGDAAARAMLEAQAIARPRDAASWPGARASPTGRATEGPPTCSGISPTSRARSRARAGGRSRRDRCPATGVAAGQVWGPYGIYTYRRPTPGALLLPGMPQIVWAD